MTLEEEARKDINIHLRSFFTEYRLPDELVEEMVKDVKETSAYSEGYYSTGDISLACQRVIMGHLELI